MNEIAFDEVKKGVELPVFSLPLTVQRLVMEAAANRDFTPIHHDREITRATGAPDPYANTMLIQALFEATLRDWMGLAGKLRRLKFTMRGFATAGAILSGHGRVTAMRAEQSGRDVDIDIWTDCGGVQTATGTATVWLPSQGAQP